MMLKVSEFRQRCNEKLKELGLPELTKEHIKSVAEEKTDDQTRRAPEADDRRLSGRVGQDLGEVSDA